MTRNILRMAEWKMVKSNKRKIWRSIKGKIWRSIKLKIKDLLLGGWRYLEDLLQQDYRTTVQQDCKAEI